MIVHRHRQHALGVVLSDHVTVQHGTDFSWARNTVARLDQGVLVLFADDVHAKLDAFITDEYRRPRNQLANLVLALPAEGAVEGILFLSHPVPSTPSGNQRVNSSRARRLEGANPLVSACRRPAGILGPI